MTTSAAQPGARAQLADWARAGLGVYAALLLVTCIAALTTTLAPSLVSSRPPRPTLHTSIGAIAGILLTNATVLIVPFLLVLLGFGATWPFRLWGDLLVVPQLVYVAVRVGAELGRWQHRIWPYLPHVPVEYAAAAAATGVWISHRRGPRPPARELTRPAIAALTLLVLAAALEVLATPHAR